VSEGVKQIECIIDQLVERLALLEFRSPIHYVYNPLEYARLPHIAYWRRYFQPHVEVMLLGMNPGPWGMAQTGVPFGDVTTVAQWLGIHEPVGAPARQHPKRPVRGFDCPRAEISGQRVWGWARQRFGTPQRFFKRFWVGNYCPLVFMEESGRNRTPDKLPRRRKNAAFGHLQCRPRTDRAVGSSTHGGRRGCVRGPSGATGACAYGCACGPDHASESCQPESQCRMG
jgi:single-strand selective monofunctional uracil DNA glycosylase